MAQKMFQYVVSQDGTTKMHAEAESELNALLAAGYRLTNVTTVPFAKGDNSSECLLVINILEDNSANNVGQINANANRPDNPATADSLDWLKGVNPDVLKALLNNVSALRTPTN